MSSCQQNHSSEREVVQQITCAAIQYHSTILPSHTSSVTSHVQPWFRESTCTRLHWCIVFYQLWSLVTARLHRIAIWKTRKCMHSALCQLQEALSRNIRTRCRNKRTRWCFRLCLLRKKDLEKLLERRVSLTIFTDSKKLFDVITKCSQTQEGRLRADLQSSRDAYAVHDISNVGFIRSPDISADGLTKSASVMLCIT